MKRVRRILHACVSLIVFVVVWETVSRLGLVERALFPPPSQVAMALCDWAASGEMLIDLRASLWRAIAGFTLGSGMGIVAGLGTGRIRVLDSFFSPVLQVVRPLPPVAIIPLVIVWFGIGEGAKVFAVAFAVFWPVWVACHHGCREVPQTYIWSAQKLNCGRWRTLWAVVLPGSLTYIVTGLRTGIAVSFVMVYVCELAGASNGLGYQISVSHLAYRVDRMLAAMLVLGACGAAADLALTRTLWKVFPWLRLTAQR